MCIRDRRGLDEYDMWMDMEQMGLPVPQGYSYYRPEEVTPPEMYPPYYGGTPYMVPYGAPVAPGYGIPYDAPVYVDEYGRVPPMVERDYQPIYNERPYAYAHMPPPRGVT